jgi:adenylate cyclase class 2
MNNQEIEAKFYVNDLKRVEARLLEMGARLAHPRLLETNIRFDLPDRSLSAASRVLRLRQADDIRITYKGKAEIVDGVMSRTELEFTVGDFETARQVIEALGYVQIAVYEKFRATYQWQTSEVSENIGGLVHVMLDELPYGDFVEIEGADADSIRATAARLGLDWEAAIPASYLALFERVRADASTSLSTSLGLDPAKLTFAALNDFQPSADRLNVRAADLRKF